MSIEEQYNRAKDTPSMVRLFVPYQREGVLWLLSMENQTSGVRGGILADEMGSGKKHPINRNYAWKPKTSYPNHRAEVDYHPVVGRDQSIRHQTLTDQHL
jgi:hypothetical protein